MAARRIDIAHIDRLNKLYKDIAGIVAATKNGQVRKKWSAHLDHVRELLLELEKS